MKKRPTAKASKNAAVLRRVRESTRWKAIPVVKGRLQQKQATIIQAEAVEPTCIQCGCTEFNACPPGCAWIYLNKANNWGICSACFYPLAHKNGLR